MSRSVLALAALTLLSFGVDAFAEGDARRGAQAYRACVACHALEPSLHLSGPSLDGFMGRMAGTAEGFVRFSPGLKDAGFSWNAAALDGWLDADCYVCGPAPFMDLVEQTLLAASVPREHVFVERFVSPSDPDEVSARQASTKAAGDLAVPDQIRVRWDGKLHLVPYREGQTLLEAAVAAGVDPPYSCEEGYCSSCQAKLTSGQVKMAVNDCLSDDEIADGCILACQAYPLTEDIEIDWDA